MSDRGLSILVHGPAGGGKTTLTRTAPKPILFMDAENAARFFPRNIIKKWDPLSGQPAPEWDGTWEICVVKIRSWDVAVKTYEYLKSGRHPFRTVVIDSISEIQVKAKEEINGRNAFQTQHWGRLLQNMGGFLRDLRDLADDDESNPIEILYLISTSRQIVPEAGGPAIWKPYLEGSIATIVPYLFDITAYLYVDTVPVPGNPAATTEHRFFFTGNHHTIEAKSRAPGVPPNIQDPNLQILLDNIFPEDDPIVYEAPTPVDAAPAAPVEPAKTPKAKATPPPEPVTSVDGLPGL